MELHAGIGANILAGSSSEVRQMGEEIVLSRHVRWDGSGYPYRIAELFLDIGRNGFPFGDDSDGDGTVVRAPALHLHHSRRSAFFGKQGLEDLGLHRGELAHNGGGGLIRERLLSNRWTSGLEHS